MFTFALTCLLTAAVHAEPAPHLDAVVNWEQHRLETAVTPSWREAAWGAGRRLRLEARASGLPIDNLHLVLGLRFNGSLRRQYGRFPRLSPLKPQPISAQQAIVRSEAIFSRWGNGQLWVPRATQTYYVDEHNLAHHAWRIEGSTAAPLQTFSLWLDAASGYPLGIRKTSFSSQAQVYPRSPAHSELVLVELDNTNFGILSGEYAVTSSCDDWVIDDSFFGVNQCYDTSQHAVADGNGDFLFLPDPGSSIDPLAEVQAFYHAEAISRHLDDTMEFSHESPIKVIVNFPMANAFFADFDGDGTGDISFGHSDEGIDYAYDADVVYHEFGHSVIDAISRLGSLSADELGLVWTSGALHEGSADAFSMFLTKDPSLGSYAGTLDGVPQPIRDLEFDRSCPNDLMGEVHADGEIWASLFWNLIEDEAVGAELAQELLFASASTWGPSITWPEAGASLVDATAELLEAAVIDEATRDQVIAHLHATNILECDRIIDLLTVDRSTQFIFNLGLFGDFAQIPGGNQFRVQVPEDATALAINLTNFITSSEHLGLSVFIREGSPIAHQVTSAAALGLGMAVPTDFDHKIDLVPGDATLRLGDNGEFELISGATYYISIASLNLGGIELLDFTTGWVDLSAELIYPNTQPTQDDPGCSCQNSRFRARTGPWALLLLLAFIFRRNRDFRPDYSV
jgi:hypothetical protein